MTQLVTDGPSLIAVRNLSAFLAARGIKASPRTCKRWTREGVGAAKTVRLETKKYGGSPYVSVDDINKFFDALNS